MELVAIHLLTLVGFTRIAELFPVLAPLQLGKIAFALGAVVLAACLSRHRGPGSLFDLPLLKPVLLLFLLAALSVPLSVWRSGALESFEGVTKTIFIFAVLSFAGARTGGNSVRLALLIGVVVLGGMMVVEKGSGRAFVSSTYDANDIALLFAMFLPVLAAEGMAQRGIMRLVAWGGACIALLGMAMTQSRGGVIALAVVALQMVLSSRRRGLLLLALGVAGAIFYMSADTAYWDRFALVGDASDDYNMTADTGRLQLWKSGLSMLLRNPVLGVGVGQFAAANYTFGNGAYLTAHNTYIQVATEMGVFALWVYVCLLRNIIAFAREGAASPSLDEAARMRWLGVRYGITAFMVGIFFVSQAFAISFYGFMAMVSAMRSGQQALDVPVAVQAEPASAGSRRRDRKGRDTRTRSRRSPLADTRWNGLPPLRRAGKAGQDV